MHSHTEAPCRARSSQAKRKSRALFVTCVCSSSLLLGQGRACSIPSCTYILSALLCPSLSAAMTRKVAAEAALRMSPRYLLQQKRMSLFSLSSTMTERCVAAAKARAGVQQLGGGKEGKRAALQPEREPAHIRTAIMALRVECQQTACARAAGVGAQLRGSRCGLRSVALACPKRLSLSRVAFGCPGGVQNKKDSAVAASKAAGKIG